ncbi:MAG TPA: F0F1 ATP synthase subunit gamma, partial [Solirubrobacterales bacterium]|nr:F0F1 ATP synthase subunit gamma [Solirubrobacterales bacterium]
MANRRVLVKRRKSVRNIRKITRTMQLIATARFQAAFNRAVATRPYTEKLAELVADLSRAAGDVDHPLLKTHEDVKRAAVVVLTADRGLAGGYNASVLRTAITHLDQQIEQGIASDVHMVGKKGISYFRFLRREVAEQTTGVGDKPRFEQVEPIANALIDRFVRGEIASAHVVYMKFLSAGQQRPVAVQILPLKPETAEGKEAAKPVEYEFSPDPQQLLDEQPKGVTTDVHMVGKKGISYFRFLRRPVAEQTFGIGDRPRFDQVEPIANALIDRFVRGEIASAHVAYMKFLSAGQQRP